MGTVEQIINDTLDGGIAPIELVIQAEIEKQRGDGESDRMDRVTIPAPPRAVGEVEML